MDASETHVGHGSYKYVRENVHVQEIGFSRVQLQHNTCNKFLKFIE